MHRFSHHAVGVQQGDVLLFSAFEDGGEMWTGQGPRQIHCPVTFDGAFLTPPLVHVSIAMWDMGEGTNQRADITTEGVTETGFTILFRTWEDTRVARIRAAWLAIGPVRYDDDWDL